MELDDLKTEHGQREVGIDVDASWDVVATRIARARRRMLAQRAAVGAMALLVVAGIGAVVATDGGRGSEDQTPVVADEGDIAASVSQPVDDPSTTAAPTTAAPTTVPTEPETTPDATDRFGGLLAAHGVTQGDGSTRLDIPLVTGTTMTLVLTPAAAEELASVDLAQHVEVSCAGCGAASVSLTSPGHGGELGEPIETLDGGAFLVETSVGRLLRWEVDGWLLEASLQRVPAGQEQALADALGLTVVDGWPTLASGPGLQVSAVGPVPLVLARDLAEDDAAAPLEVQFNGSDCEPGTVRDVGAPPEGAAQTEVCLSGDRAALIAGDPDRVAAVAAGLTA